MNEYDEKIVVISLSEYKTLIKIKTMYELFVSAIQKRDFDCDVANILKVFGIEDKKDEK